MQTVRIAASFHDTPGLLIHDLHFIIEYYIFYILLEQGIGFQQLIDSMYPFGFHRIILDQFILLRQFFFIILRVPFDLCNLRADIREDKEFRIFTCSSNGIMSLIGQVDRIQFFIDHKIQRIGNLRHSPVIFLHVFVFRLDQDRFIAFFTQKLDQRFVFGQSFMCPQ